MSSVFDLDKIPDSVGKLNMEDLYEKKQKYDQQQLDVFNKILGKIHLRIKYISNQRNAPLICWYVVPETVIGIPRYDQSACIIYLLAQLEENGFSVKYIFPNLLCICWQHYIPKYIRTKIYQSTGMSINEYGEKLPEEEEDPIEELPIQTATTTKKAGKTYTPLTKYKPTGNLIYDDKYLNIDK
jgi:hypothetical protein